MTKEEMKILERVPNQCSGSLALFFDKEVSSFILRLLYGNVLFHLVKKAHSLRFIFASKDRTVWTQYIGVYIHILPTSESTISIKSNICTNLTTVQKMDFQTRSSL